MNLQGHRFRRAIRGGTMTPAILLLAAVLSFAPGAERRTSGQQPIELRLRVERAADWAKRDTFLAQVPDPADWGLERIDAFEEYWSFIYLSGTRDMDPPSESASQFDDAVSKPRIVRRVLLLKPSFLVIDDQVRGAQARRVDWVLESGEPLQYEGVEFRPAGTAPWFRCRAVLPATLGNIDGVDARAPAVSPYRIKRVTNPAAHRARFLHVMSLAQESESFPRCEVEERKGELFFRMSYWDALTAVERVMELTLPDGETAGTISIFDRKGYIELRPRLLPAGVLSPGEEALQLRQGWDLAYRAEGWTVWDTGHPSTRLRELVETGEIKPCRVVELGCGSGNDAVYLAAKEFQVTGIDIAPTALSMARDRARKAGVTVTLLLADVLRPPRLEPFDLAFDRGCYHEVRRDHAQAYVAALKQLVRPGGRVLILAGNANPDPGAPFLSPPRVREEDIRADFAQDFKLVWLRPFRFDPVPPRREGPLAWSFLLERREK
jgi:SAM-dependent methyltransferase